MKKIILPALLWSVCILINAQVPQGFNYQAIAWDDSGEPIVNTTIPVRLTIQSDSLGGTIFWQELHSSIITNDLGLFSLVVGKGVKQAGTASLFGDIDWTVTPKFIKVEVDYDGWKSMGSTRLWAVPYSMVAKDLSGSINKLTVAGETSSMDEPLFEVKNKNGQTVFAVYNEGVRIYVDDGDAKGLKGGFAIGGLDPVKGTGDLFIVNADSIRAYIDTNEGKGLKGGFAIGGINALKASPEEYLRVTRDSTRIYINDQTVKGVKGGFAIGGFDNAKAGMPEYLRVTDDSTRIYVNDSGKGLKGGFAIGGFDNTKGTATPFTALSPDNYFIGHRSGINNSTGLYNSFLGFEAGFSNTEGSDNALFGYQSGYSNNTGSGNLFLGYQSGYSNTTGSNNSFLGYKSGYSNTTGQYNSFMGSYTGVSNTEGSYNTFSGYEAGYANVDGEANNFFGTGSGYSNISGSNNIFIGPESGYYNDYGNYNTYIGYRAGYKGTTAYSNVAIGYQSGYELTLAYQNVFVGHLAGKNTTWGESNVFVGNSAGLANITGGSNVHVGAGAGEKANANNNTFVGWGTGFDNTSGGSNTFVGTQAGFNTTTGNNNVAIGNGAGYGNQTGSGNVFIGNYAGYSETSSNKLHIDNKITTTPLIYGDFSGKYLRINGDLYVDDTFFRMSNDPGTGTYPTYYVYQGGVGSTSKQYAFSVRDALWVTGPSFYDSYLNINVPNGGALYVADDEALWYNGTYFSWGYGGSYNIFADKVTVGGIVSPGGYGLYVVGSAYSTGTWAGSDERWKKNISDYGLVLDKLVKLNPVTYEWRKDEFPDMGFEDGSQVGLIAQDVEKLFPELVRTDENGYKAVSYEKLSVLLLEGMKEQQYRIESQEQKIAKLENMVNELLEVNQKE